MRRLPFPTFVRFTSGRSLLLVLLVHSLASALGCAEGAVADPDKACSGAFCADMREHDATEDTSLPDVPADTTTSQPDQAICTVNACGGCATLVGAPNASCGTCGKYVCDGDDALHCEEGGGNACGGCTTLSMVPGDPCGTCGEVVCDGNDNVVCDETAGGNNSCGGCQPLDGVAGSPCGTCGKGVWTCISANSIVCQNDTLNGCGGCTPLPSEPNDPCGTCGGGTYECQGTDAVQCTGAENTNACGGCGALTGSIGDACGACSSGSLACSSDGSALECQGATACDNCSPTGGTDGNDSVATATWLGNYDDMDDWSDRVDWLHSVTDIDIFAAHVDDLAFGTMDIVATLEQLSADYDLCVFWERDDGDLADVYCPDSSPATLGGMPGCCSWNPDTDDEIVSLVDNTGGFGVDDSGTVYYVVTAYDTAIGCFSYELWYAF